MCVTSQMGPSHMSHWSHIRITISLSHPSHIGITHRIGLSHWTHIGIAHTIWIVQKDHAKTDKGSRTNHCNLDHPLPLPLRCPSPLLPLRCHCANHCCHRSAIHCWQHRCIAVAPSITIVACRFCCPLSSTHPPSCRTSSSWSLLIYLGWLSYLLITPLLVVMVAFSFMSPPISNNGTIVFINALVVMPLYSLPEAPLPHVSIANWQAFDLIWMHITLLRHVGK